MNDNNINNSLDQEVLIEEEKKEPKLSLFQRILNTFINPTKVMEDINIKPTILVPMLIIVVVFTLLNVARFQLLKEFTIKQLEIGMAQNPNASGLSEVPENLIMPSVYTGLIAASIAPLFIMLIKGLFAHGITRLFDGKGKMKQTFSVITFALFIVLLGEVIRAIIGLLVGNYMVTTSLAAAIPNLEVNTPLFSLLAQFDIFSIWYLIVSTIGISIAHKISKGKAAVAVFVPWAIIVGYYGVMFVIKG